MGDERKSLKRKRSARYMLQQKGNVERIAGPSLPDSPKVAVFPAG